MCCLSQPKSSNSIAGPPLKDLRVWVKKTAAKWQSPRNFAAEHVFSVSSHVIRSGVFHCLGTGLCVKKARLWLAAVSQVKANNCNVWHTFVWSWSDIKSHLLDMWNLGLPWKKLSLLAFSYYYRFSFHRFVHRLIQDDRRFRRKCFINSNVLS